MNWNETLSVDIASIDLQHQAIISMINELHDATSEGNSKLVIGSVITKLIAYTEIHFAHEEKCMEDSCFVSTLAHKCQHLDLIRKVKQFERDFISGIPNLNYELLNFLKDWLEIHIKKTDKQYTSHFKESGIV